MSSFLTGFEVLQRVYKHLQQEYGVGTLSLPERSTIIAGGADRAGETPWKLWYQDFSIVRIPLGQTEGKRNDLRKDPERNTNGRIWVLGLGEGTGRKDGYAGDLVGVSVNTAAIMGEHLVPYLSRFAGLQQSLVQALSDGPLAFQSRLSSRVAREAKEILPRHLVRSTGYSGQQRAREFSSVEIKYREEVLVDGDLVQPTDEAEDADNDKGTDIRASSPKMIIGEKRDVVVDLSDIILRVLKSS